MYKNTARVLSVAGLMAASFSTFATTYPLTVTDLAGQKVTIDKAPQRVILQDGRDLLALAVLDKANPFQHVVAWNNLLKKTDSGTWDMLKSKWPESAKILDMGFSDKGQIDLETVIAKKPDLMIAQLRAKDPWRRPVCWINSPDCTFRWCSWTTNWTRQKIPQRASICWVK